MRVENETVELANDQEENEEGDDEDSVGDE